MTADLYHFTCTHTKKVLGSSGVLRPNWHPFLRSPVVWLTDLERPTREQLGLTSTILSCDRMAVRYTAMVRAISWRTFATLSQISAEMLAELEGPGTAPDHWFVSTVPVPVVREKFSNRIRRAA